MTDDTRSHPPTLEQNAVRDFCTRYDVDVRGVEDDPYRMLARLGRVVDGWKRLQLELVDERAEKNDFELALHFLRPEWAKRIAEDNKKRRDRHVEVAAAEAAASVDSMTDDEVDAEIRERGLDGVPQPERWRAVRPDEVPLAVGTRVRSSIHGEGVVAAASEALDTERRIEFRGGRLSMWRDHSEQLELEVLDDDQLPVNDPSTNDAPAGNWRRITAADVPLEVGTRVRRPGAPETEGRVVNAETYERYGGIRVMQINGQGWGASAIDVLNSVEILDDGGQP